VPCAQHVQTHRTNYKHAATRIRTGTNIHPVKPACTQTRRHITHGHTWAHAHTHTHAHRRTQTHTNAHTHTQRATPSVQRLGYMPPRDRGGSITQLVTQDFFLYFLKVERKCLWVSEWSGAPLSSCIQLWSRREKSVVPPALALSSIGHVLPVVLVRLHARVVRPFGDRVTVAKGSCKMGTKLIGYLRVGAVRLTQTTQHATLRFDKQRLPQRLTFCYLRWDHFGGVIYAWTAAL
jgi:hypothetical protein